MTAVVIDIGLNTERRIIVLWLHSKRLSLESQKKQVDALWGRGAILADDLD